MNPDHLKKTLYEVVDQKVDALVATRSDLKKQMDALKGKEESTEVKKQVASIAYKLSVNDDENLIYKMIDLFSDY